MVVSTTFASPIVFSTSVGKFHYLLLINLVNLALAAKTMARIEAGLKRFAPESFLTVHRHEYRTAPLDLPAPTMTASGNHLGLIVPVKGRDGKQATSTAEPLRTMTTRNETGVVVMLPTAQVGWQGLPAESVWTHW